MSKRVRAGIYVRISMDREGAGLGVQRQEEDCRALCERQGWQVVEVFSDNDISAYTGKKRPGYLNLLDALSERRINAVVAWHPDRLHRSPRELEDFIDAVEKAKAEVATVTAGTVDLSSPSGRMTARIVGAVARHESEHKSERVRRAMRQRAEQGKTGTGKRAFGFERDGTTIREKEARLIREAAERVLAGESMRSVVMDFRARKVPTVTGAMWSHQALRRILTSPRTAGKRSHLGQVIAEDAWPAILPSDQWLRLRALFSSRQAPGRGRKHLLSGVLECGLCGTRMVASTVTSQGRRYERYSCTANAGGCGRCGIDRRADDVVAEMVLAALDNLTLKKRLRVASPLDQLDAVEARRVEMAGMYARGEISQAEWAAARAGLSEEIDRLHVLASEQAREETVRPLLKNPRGAWPDLLLDQKRAVIGAVVEKIVVSEARPGAQFDPGRLVPVWKV